MKVGNSVDFIPRVVSKSSIELSYEVAFINGWGLAS